MSDISRIQFAKDTIQFILNESYCRLNNFFPCTTEDNQIPLYTESVEQLLQLIEINNNNQLIKPISVTTSSGAVLILIFKNFVIKIFNSHRTWSKVSTILNQLKHSDYIVKITHSISQNNLHAISTERLIPIVEHNTYGNHHLIYKFDHQLVLQLFRNISCALRSIHSIGYQQGDCTWDNIGMIGNRFVLFDFNCAQQLMPYRNSSDVPQLIKSGLYNLQYNNYDDTEQITIDFLLKLKNLNLTDGFQLYNKVMSK